MYKRIIHILLIFIILPVFAWGGDSLYYSKRSIQSPTKAVKKLSKSLEKEQPDEEIAANYLSLAQGLVAQQEYVKAENYLSQAINLYIKGKNREQTASTYRELARIQELQNKFDEAISNYSNAAQNTRKKDFKEINRNDVNRLRNRNNPQEQSKFIQRNINISSVSRNKEESAISYEQMAQNKLDMNDKSGAITEFKNALDNVKEKPEEAMRIKQEIAKTYVADEQYEKAITLNEELINEAKRNNDVITEIKQLQNLSHIYFETNKPESGIPVLKQAYDLAINNGETMQARNVLLLLAEQYKKNKNTTETLKLYSNFINGLDTLIQSDNTLIDAKTFQLHEERITRLEKERVLKDELIARTNRLNYVLFIFIAFILIFVILIIRALYSINRKNKKIALQSLRREMNPHFIFNSLNSVNQFIAQNKELEANKYLASYSKLMRNIMENSNKDFISLTKETEQLKEYLELEHLRFQDKFSFQISVDETLDTDAVYIPNMLIQPQLENAIWHGLRYKEEDNGLLNLVIQLTGNTLQVIIEDNGIGLKRSQELKTKHQRQHSSRGMTNTRERIQLLNQLYGTHISLDITEKQEPETGVIVTLLFPLINKTIHTDEHSAKNKKRNS